jgi:hypothetical protein
MKQLFPFDAPSQKVSTMSMDAPEMVFAGALPVASTEAAAAGLAEVAPLPTAAATRWPNISPDAMMATLRELTRQHPTQCDKFPGGYKGWHTLKAAQQSKVLQVYDRLSLPMKTACDNNAITLTARMADTAAAQLGVSTSGVRCVTATKDDLARLLHLRKEPSAASLWFDSEISLTRAQLDARNSVSAPAASASGSSNGAPAPSTATLADDMNPWRGHLQRLGLLQRLPPPEPHDRAPVR